jgi:hypothetical protein
MVCSPDAEWALTTRLFSSSDKLLHVLVDLDARRAFLPVKKGG